MVLQKCTSISVAFAHLSRASDTLQVKIALNHFPDAAAYEVLSPFC